ETIRRAKNGEIVEVSVTVSPVRDEDGNIIGASKILRDVTDGKRAAQRQRRCIQVQAKQQYRAKYWRSLKVDLPYSDQLALQYQGNRSATRRR
ncbi:MAG: PAS domain-containing protein, partial [Pseudomonadota bacterium]